MYNGEKYIDIYENEQLSEDRRKIKAYSPTVSKAINEIKETFDLNLDKIKEEYIKQNIEDESKQYVELVTVYKVFEFIKRKGDEVLK